jgi:hypothetical protein
MKFERRLTWLLGLILLGTLFRALYLASPALWVDEAESAINGLSIHTYGVPVGEYLGIPVFENTLIRVNDSDPEYAFDDASYNRDGVAIYHGWLPLYAIAASQWLLGIEPGQEPLQGPRSLAEMRWRTVAARLPAVVFSALFLAMIFLLARAAFGEPAAWTTLVAAAFSHSLVWLGHQARYYSLTLLLIATVLFMLMRLARQGRTRDYLLALAVYLMLFYTHLLSFFVAVLCFGLLLPWLIRHRYWLLHLIGFAVAGLLLTVPWLAYTDYLAYLGEIPRGWSLLKLPEDLFVYPALQADLMALYLVGVLILAGVWWLGRSRHQQDQLDWILPVYLLVVWCVVAYFAYLFLIPAPSFFFNRVSLILLVPGTVLVAAVFAYPAQRLLGRVALFVAPLLCLVFLISVDRVRWPGPVFIDNADTYAPVNQLAALGLSDAARYYAPPNDQLPLSYYSNLPFQSIAPIRTAFLDNWPGEIVFVERAVTKPSAEIISPALLMTAAALAGETLTETDAALLSSHLASQPERALAATTDVRLVPPLAPAPAYARPLLAVYERVLEEDTAEWLAQEMPAPIRHDYELRSATDWWRTFFYRFVDPDSQKGARANYYQRLCRAEVHVEPGSYWKVTVSRQPVDASDPCPTDASAGRG